MFVLRLSVRVTGTSASSENRSLCFCDTIQLEKLSHRRRVGLPTGKEGQIPQSFTRLTEDGHCSTQFHQDILHFIILKYVNCDRQ